MSEVIRRPAGSYREKTLVLCIYRYLTKDHRGSVWVDDSIVIKVEFSDQILDAFIEKIGEMKRRAWTPAMLDVELLSYRPSNGLEKF